MCNAWNHPIDCTCGWGGSGHIDSTHHSPPPLTKSIESYTIPNAHCPVCNQGVFFYCATNGGRVFFDELGPPWPKHPCTSHNSTPSRFTHRHPRNSSPKEYKWQQDNWHPLFISNLIEIIPNIFQIRGSANKIEIAMFCNLKNAPTLKQETICLFRTIATGAEISYLSSQGHPCSIRLFESRIEAERSAPLKQIPQGTGHIAKKLTKTNPNEAEINSPPTIKGANKFKRKSKHAFNPPKENTGSQSESKREGVATQTALAIAFKSAKRIR